MTRVFLAAAAFASAFAFAAQASALTISNGGVAAGNSGLSTAVAGALVETFDNGPSGGLVQSWSWTTSDPSLHIVSGNLSGRYAQPWGDTTHYYSAAEYVPGYAHVAFGGSFDYLGLYWGSVDAYNLVQLFSGGQLVAAIDGTMAWNPANGDQGWNGSVYVNITDVVFDEARFYSSQYAFEFDNLAVADLSPQLLQVQSQVPEPATLGLFAAALAGLGAGVRRRRRG